MTKADEIETHNEHPSRIGKAVRFTGRAAKAPFRRTLEAPRVNFKDNEEVWGAEEWSHMLSAVRRRPKAELEAEFEGLTDEQKYWTNPANWPERVRQHIAMNIQFVAIMSMGVIGLAIAAIGRAGLELELTQGARISFLCGGIFGLLVGGVMYYGACADYWKLVAEKRIALAYAVTHIKALWPFEETWGPIAFFWKLPGHIRTEWQIRNNVTEVVRQQRRSKRETLKRLLIVLVVMLAAMVFAYALLGIAGGLL